MDTNFLILHGFEEVLKRGFLSAVVLQELTAGARDGGMVRSLDADARRLEQRGRLLVPTRDDWFYAGKVLNSLYRGLRSRQSHVPVSIPREEQQRLLRDVLIARSAKRISAGLLTYNRSDFEKIRRFCKVRLVAPADYF